MVQLSGSRNDAVMFSVWFVLDDFFQQFFSPKNWFFTVIMAQHSKMAPNSSADLLEKTDVSSQMVGLSLGIETPENVRLNYQLAGPTARCIAYFIDFLIRMVSLVFIAIGLLMSGGIFSPLLSVGLFLVIYFLVEWAYYIVSEGFFRGKTFGKHAMGIRVIQERGYPLTLWSAVLRNLLRAADALPSFAAVAGVGLYGVGFFTMLSTKNFQRLGDLVARTIVVTERSIQLPQEPIILEKIRPLSREDIGRFIPDQRALSIIEQFLGRRHQLTHQRGHALALVLAIRLAERLEFRGDAQQVQNYPMAFLARVYVTFLDTRDAQKSRQEKSAETEHYEEVNADDLETLYDDLYQDYQRDESAVPTGSQRDVHHRRSRQQESRQQESRQQKSRRQEVRDRNERYRNEQDDRTFPEDWR